MFGSLQEVSILPGFIVRASTVGGSIAVREGGARWI